MTTEAEPGPPDLPLRLVRPTLDDIPQHELPAGYSIRGYERGDTAVWTDIQRASEEHLRIDDTTFAREFGDDEDRLRDRCLFVVTDDGEAVGTVTAWEGPYVAYDSAVIPPTDLRALLVARRAARAEEPWGLPCWYAIRPAHQGHGLARPMLTAVLQRVARHHTRCWALTSTGRPKSIRLQVEFGFRPDLAVPQSRAAWEVAVEIDPGLAGLVSELGPAPR